MHYRSKLVGFGLGFSLFLFFAGCEENAVPLDLSNTPMDLDTISFPVTEMVSYQSPPEMGKADFLYFGKKDGYVHPYGLVSVKQYDQYNVVNMSILNDSLITVDSVALVLNAVSGTGSDSVAFQLRYFPDGPDSLFSELNTQYHNFNPDIASGVISTARLEADTTDTVNTNYRLKFLFGDEVVSHFIDTTRTNHNRSFLIEPVEELNTLYSFYSRENSVDKEPLMTVYYRRFSVDSSRVDTLSLVFRTAQDLTVTLPGPLTERDTTEIAISQAKGLKVLVFTDFSSFELPPKAVIKTADLIFYSTEDSLSRATVVSYPISVPGIFDGFQTYEDDPFQLNLGYFQSTNRNDFRFDVETRDFVTAVTNGKTQNYGLKLYSSSYNDPFQTIYLHGLESDSLAPFLRIQYVVP